jgi:cell division protein FtsW
MPDRWILYSVVLLFLMGETAIISANVLSASEFDVQTLKRPVLQLVLFFAGLLSSFYIAKIDYKRLFKGRWVYLSVWFSLVSLFIVLVKKLTSGKAVERWLLSGSIQPLEFAKIAIIIFLSYYIVSKGSLRSIKTFSWAFFIVLLHAIFLVLQPDKGGALFILLLSFSLMYVGGIPYRLYIPTIALVGFFSFFLLKKGYVSERLSAWIDPFADAEDTGYQIIQSLYALAKGGPFGVGIGKGIQKMGALPEADTDYVISIIGEEMGFLGVMMVVLLYALLVGRLFYYSVKVDEPFGKLLLFGIAMNFSLAFLWNLAMASNLLPPKGIALPFVSYGTSNLFASLIMIGLAQSVIKVWQRERTFSTLTALTQS